MIQGDIKMHSFGYALSDERINTPNGPLPVKVLRVEHDGLNIDLLFTPDGWADFVARATNEKPPVAVDVVPAAALRHLPPLNGSSNPR